MLFIENIEMLEKLFIQNIEKLLTSSMFASLTSS